ncbi:MAG: DNA-processing protein DprA [Porticoccaceae bacterium]|nr:DNA-processing protein DprA [Porticoccaceae bacterium]
MDRECHYALVSQQLDNFTPKFQRQLLEQAQTYCAIFEQAIDDFAEPFHPLLQDLRHQYERATWRQSLDSIEQQSENCGAHIIPITSVDYPQQLKQIVGAPSLLYLRGNIENLHLPQIAVVGSRRMTRGGADNARAWSQYLAAGGFAITSGLALGVDGAAHRGALQAKGKTIAVMATGIDSIYPRSHLQLAEQIIDQGGTLITEFKPTTKPLATHFPSRNRIISGLSLGVLVVEAALRSGSLITARYALEQDREVFAIPGSIHNPQSRGCHHLIKQGAYLVERAEEIVEQLAGGLSALASNAGFSADKSQAEAAVPEPQLEADESQLLLSLGFDPKDMDSLVTEGLFSIADLSRLLVALEIKGLIESQNGFYQRLK